MVLRSSTWRSQARTCHGTSCWSTTLALACSTPSKKCTRCRRPPRVSLSKLGSAALTRQEPTQSQSARSATLWVTAGLWIAQLCIELEHRSLTADLPEMSGDFGGRAFRHRGWIPFPGSPRPSVLRDQAVWADSDNLSQPWLSALQLRAWQVRWTLPPISLERVWQLRQPLIL